MTTLTVPSDAYQNGAAAAAAAQPGDTIVMNIDNDDLPLGNGGYIVVVNGNGNTIDGTARGSDTITLFGTLNVVSTGALQNSITESGPGPNVIVTRAPGTGLNFIHGANAVNDILDLRPALSASDWDGTWTTVANYLSVSQVGSVAKLWVVKTVGGQKFEIAEFEDAPAGLTVQQILDHAIIDATSPLDFSLDLSPGGTVLPGVTLDISGVLSDAWSNNAPGNPTMDIQVSGPGPATLSTSGVIVNAGSVLAADVAALTFSATVPGSYTVVTTATNQAGITVSDAVPVTVSAPPPPPPAGNVIPVGPMEFYTDIASAVANSKAGDTILIDAGVYMGADITIGHDLTIKALTDGTVSLVPVTPDPTPNINCAKGGLVIGTNISAPNVTIQGLEFSGYKSGQSNGAGIRFQSGNLTALNCYIHDNQDGIMGNPFITGTGTITLDGCRFEHNGGDAGQAHGIYCGFVDSFTARNTVFTNAHQGHEVKCRARTGLIEDCQILDLPTSDCSYLLDLPNGGNHTVRNNVFVKGVGSASGICIHVGGPEEQNPGTVTLSGNTITNNYPNAALLWNQTITPVNVQGNTLTGFNPLPIKGMSAFTGNVDGTGAAIPDATTTFGTAAQTMDYSTDPADHTISLTKGNTVVQGGPGRLTITGSAPNCVVIGGSGGVDITDAPPVLGVFTMAGSTNSLKSDYGAWVTSAGNDTIAVGQKSRVTVWGTADVTMSSGNLNDLYVDGVATVASTGGHDTILVRPGGVMHQSGLVAGLHIAEHDGNADFAFSTVQGGPVSAGSASGSSIEIWQTGAVSTNWGAVTPGAISLTNGHFTVSPTDALSVTEAGASVTAQTNNTGFPLTFVGGAQADSLSLGSGPNVVSPGSGTLAVSLTSGAVVEWDFSEGKGGGTTTISRVGIGVHTWVWIAADGTRGPLPKATTAADGANWKVTLTDGSVIEFLTQKSDPIM